MKQNTPNIKQAQDKTHLVQVSIAGKGETTYFYNSRVEAVTFFDNHCKDMNIDCAPLTRRHTWAREERHGMIIDFEKIDDLELQSLFELH